MRQEKLKTDLRKVMNDFSFENDMRNMVALVEVLITHEEYYIEFKTYMDAMHKGQINIDTLDDTVWHLLDKIDLNYIKKLDKRKTMEDILWVAQMNDIYISEKGIEKIATRVYQEYDYSEYNDYLYSLLVEDES